MAYETGTASNPGDLLVKLFDFAATNGWTINDDIFSSTQSPIYGHMSKIVGSPAGAGPTTVNLNVGFYWDANNINIYPSTGYTAGQPPHLQPNYYRHTTALATVGQTGHRTTNFPIGGPFDAYHFFAGSHYLYAVVEWAAGFFRHIGFCQLNKVGKWIGGETYWNHWHSQSTTYIDSPVTDEHCMGPDGVRTYNSILTMGPVMYGVQADGQPFPQLIGRNSPQSIWHMSGNDAGFGATVDSRSRDVGALQVSGPRSHFYNNMPSMVYSRYNGYRPMFPISLWSAYHQPVPDECYPLGTVPNMRFMYLDSIDNGTEFTIGADTWKVFPLSRIGVTTDDTERSRNWGYAYKK